MSKMGTVERMPNNATSENDVLMNNEQIANLQQHRDANVNYMFPQNSTVVEDDEQTIKEVLAEINAENNRHVSQGDSNAPKFDTQQRMQQPVVQSQAPPPLPQMSQQPPPVHHFVQQAMNPQIPSSHVPPHVQPPMSHTHMIHNTPHQPSVNMYDTTKSHEYTNQGTTSSSSHINNIITKFTTNAKALVVIAIIVILLQNDVISTYVTDRVHNIVPIPCIGLVLDILCCYAIYVLFMHFT